MHSYSNSYINRLGLAGLMLIHAGTCARPVRANKHIVNHSPRFIPQRSRKLVMVCSHTANKGENTGGYGANWDLEGDKERGRQRQAPSIEPNVCVAMLCCRLHSAARDCFLRPLPALRRRPVDMPRVRCESDRVCLSSMTLSRLIKTKKGCIRVKTLVPRA